MSDADQPVTTRPSVIALGIILIIIALLFLLWLGITVAGNLQTPGSTEGASVSLVDLLVSAPAQILVPLAIGIAAGIGGIGVLRARRWGAILAIGVGLALLAGGIILLWVVISELGIPGSFAMLFLPPAAVALIVGTFVLWAALATRSRLR